MALDSVINRRFGVLLLIILGAFLAISPAGLRRPSNFSPKELTATIISRTAYVTPEDVAAWIIDKRPDLLLVDLRTPDEYQQYHLPDAINIPLAKLFDKENLELLNDKQYNIILYSNGSTYASQAWVMLKEMGINTYVMEGGMNYWAQAILNPHPPGDLASNDEVSRYQFRVAASNFFNNGGVAVQTAQSSQPQPTHRKKIIRRKTKTADEGC